MGRGLAFLHIADVYPHRGSLVPRGLVVCLLAQRTECREGRRNGENDKTDVFGVAADMVLVLGVNARIRR